MTDSTGSNPPINDSRAIFDATEDRQDIAADPIPSPSDDIADTSPSDDSGNSTPILTPDDPTESGSIIKNRLIDREEVKYITDNVNFVARGKLKLPSVANDPYPPQPPANTQPTKPEPKPEPKKPKA